MHSSIAKYAKHVFRVNVKYGKRPRRYRQLLAIAAERKPKSIIEIGVFQGQRAIELIDAASLHAPVNTITYFGFDLFEGLTPELLKSELSKTPDPKDAVTKRLEGTGAQAEVVAGFTQQTIPDLREQGRLANADLIFIDGGHAIDTIRSDWRNLEPLMHDDSVVVFDDYYVDCPDRIDKFGCNRVLEEIDRTRYDVEILPDVDRFVLDTGALNVAMVKVTRRRAVDNGAVR